MTEKFASVAVSSPAQSSSSSLNGGTIIVGVAGGGPYDILFKKLHPDAIIPTRGTSASAGFDLYALEDTLIVGGAGNVLVPTGIAVELANGTYGRIAMRSGLAVKQHLGVSAGVIDIDYTGPIGVVVFSNKIFDLQNIQQQTLKLKSARITDIVLEIKKLKTSYGEHMGSLKEVEHSQCDPGELRFYDLHPLMTPHAYLIKKGERFAQLIPEIVASNRGREAEEHEGFDKKYEEHIGYGSTGTGVVLPVQK